MNSYLSYFWLQFIFKVCSNLFSSNELNTNKNTFLMKYKGSNVQLTQQEY